MGSWNLPSTLPTPRATLASILVLSAAVGCSLTKKEDPAPAASTPPTVVMGAAPVFNVAPQTGTAAPATPEAVNPGAVIASTKPKTGVGGAGGATAKTSSAPAAAGGAPAAATTAKAATGGTTAKATTAAAVVPQVDVAGCFSKCQARFATCTTAAAGDLNKLAACQSVIPACQADCQAK